MKQATEAFLRGLSPPEYWQPEAKRRSRVPLPASGRPWSTFPRLGDGPQEPSHRLAAAIRRRRSLKLKQLYSIYAKHTKQSLQVMVSAPYRSPQLLFYWNQHRHTGQASGPGAADTRLDRPVVGGPPGPAGCVWHIPRRCHQLPAAPPRVMARTVSSHRPVSPGGSESPPYPHPQLRTLF